VTTCWDLSSLRVCFPLYCSCHIHLELLVCSHCCLQPSSVKGHGLTAQAGPRGFKQKLLFIWLHATTSVGVVKNPFTRGDAVCAGPVLPADTGSNSVGVPLALRMYPTIARALPARRR